MIPPPVKIYVAAEGGGDLPTDLPTGLPVLDSTASTDQLRDALNIKPPDCSGIASQYQCGNHDNVPTYSGEIIPAKAGDELAMNSLIISVVDIDGSGNGSGLIKMPMMNNIKLGLTLTGIKVAKGGCIVAGSAELSGVSASILNEQQRANLQKAYAAYNQVIENTGAIIETYDNFSQMVNGVQKKAAALAAKIGNGGKPTKAEVEALKSLTAQTTANMQASLDVIKKQMGEQVNAEAAAKLQAMIDQNKANAAALTAPASGQPTPAALAAAASSLAATQPAQVEKQIKELPPLAVEYNGKVYAKNGTTIKMQPGKLDGVLQPNGDIELICGFFLKNTPDSQPIGWKLQTASGTDLALVEPLRVSLSNTDVYLGIKWPDGQSSLKLTATSGSRSISLNLTKPDWYVKDLKVAETRRTQMFDISSGKIVLGPMNTRTATAGQTLYIVQDNSLGIVSSRKPTYSFASNIDDGLLKKNITLYDYTNNTSSTLENGASPNNHKLTVNYDKVPHQYGLGINALGYDKNVKVQLVPFDKKEGEFAPPAVKATLYGIKEGLKTIKKVAKTLEVLNLPEFNGDVIFNDQQYNEEIEKLPLYHTVREWEGKVVFDKIKWEQKVFGIPLPKVVTKYIDLGAYVFIKGECEFVYSTKQGKTIGQNSYKLLEKDGKVQGVLGFGGRVTAKVKEGNLFTAEANGNLKSEIELMGGFRKKPDGNYIVAGGTFKPIVFSIDLKVAVSETGWSPEIEMLNVNYVKSLTNEVKLFESEMKLNECVTKSGQ